MPIGPKGPPKKPGLSSRGRVIMSTFRGVPYTRPWPPKKPTKPGSKRHLTAKAFGAANRACKVTASVFYGEHWAATRGTPLLPRDLMIAMMYGRAFALTLEDGRIIRSMASMLDVSRSLDMIGNQVGATLYRGPKYWQTTTEASAALSWFVWATNVTNLNGASAASRGFEFIALATLHIKALQLVYQTVIGRKHQVHIARMTSSHQIVSINSSDEFTSDFAGIGAHNFELIDVIQPGERVAFILSRTDGTDTSPPQNWEASNVTLPAPINPVGRLELAKAHPAPGDTFSFGAGVAFVPLVNPLMQVL